MIRIQWNSNSNASGCHCWDLLFIRHLISITSLSPRYPIWRVWIITFHYFTKGETENPHGHMTYPALQNRIFIQTYIFGSSNTWTMNFQMFKLVLEKAEESEIKLPTSAGLWKKQESSRKTSISHLLTLPNLLTVWITINWKILKEMGIQDHLNCLLRKTYMQVRKQQLELDREQQTGSK